MQLRPDQIIVNLFLCFIFGASIFLYGFFPYKFANEKFTTESDLPKMVLDVPLNKSGYQSPRHSHSVLMVIDALRLDFAQQNESMKYFHKLLKTHSACLYNLKVQPPTVTLPRIKAMITGTVPNFVDVVLNLGNSELKIDSFIHQLHKKHQRMSFCGDNTWVKLFPNTFHRQLANTDSLFVNDFYEGDKNITRRLENELKSADWQLLILHYLGLDHIGHVEGPKSAKIHKKLQEMDNVIMRIHLEIIKWKKPLQLPSLFLITSDHGMRDSGGHGGSTFGEVNVPLMVIGTNCQQTTEIYQQIDMAATVSVLLGLPIPESSIGSLITDMLSELNYEDQLYALNYNSQRLLKMISKKISANELKHKEFFKQLTVAQEFHKKFLQKSEHLEMAYKKSKLFYNSASREMSKLLSTFYGKYDKTSISTGAILMETCITLVRFVLADNFTDNLQFAINVLILIGIGMASVLVKYLICEFGECSLCFNHWSTHVIFLGILSIFYYSIETFNLPRIRPAIASKYFDSKIIQFLAFGTIFYTFSLASSSFVEEEHQTWYYMTHTFLFLLFLMSIKKRQNDLWLLNVELLKCDKRKKWNNIWSFFEQYSVEINWILLFLTLLLGRRLNQTGDKWLKQSDIGDFLMVEEHRLWNSCFVVISLCAMVYKLYEFNGILTIILTFTSAVLIYSYRTITGQVYFAGIKQASSNSSITLFWFNVLEIGCINYFPIVYKLLKRTNSRTDLKTVLGVNVTIFCIVSALLHKPHNIILNFMILFTCSMVNNSCDQLFGGRKNLFIKVVAHYWIGKMFFFYQGNSNSLASIDLNAGYVGLILTYLILLYNIFDVHNGDRSQSDIPFAMGLTSILVILPFAFCTILAIWFQSHIFIWTVFSPKLIYEFYHLCLVSILICFSRILNKLC